MNNKVLGIILGIVLVVLIIILSEYLLNNEILVTNRYYYREARGIARLIVLVPVLVIYGLYRFFKLIYDVVKNIPKSNKKKRKP